METNYEILTMHRLKGTFEVYIDYLRGQDIHPLYNVNLTKKKKNTEKKWKNIRQIENLLRKRSPFYLNTEAWNDDKLTKMKLIIFKILQCFRITV